MSLRDRSTQLFRHTFGYDPSVYTFAPVRVNLFGDHTDYCEGFVCPLAIHLGTIIAGKMVPGATCRVVSANMEEMKEFKGDSSLTRDENCSWINYVSSVVHEFITRFNIPEIGFDMAIVSDVPLGSGLSSSASLEVAVSVFLEHILNVTITPEDRALLCQEAEHNFPGVPCGVMDQFISSCGVEGNLLLIDCRSHTSELIPIQDPSISILVCNSNKKHQLTGSEYPERVRQCTEAVQVLSKHNPHITALRDVTLAQLDAARAELGEARYRRALHVLTENQRCLDCREAMANHDYDRVGQLLLESHASLRDNFEASTPELDTLVEIAVEQEGVLGARMAGGGFGGCIVCLVESKCARRVMREMEREYKQRTGLECTTMVTPPSQGARVLGEEDAEALSNSQIVLRSPVFWVSTALLVGLGFFFMLQKRKHCCVCCKHFFNFYLIFFIFLIISYFIFHSYCVVILIIIKKEHLCSLNSSSLPSCRRSHVLTSTRGLDKVRSLHSLLLLLSMLLFVQ